MKVLFLGLGSIGQRHLRNLKILMPEAEIMAYRTFKNVPFLDNENNPCKNIDLINHYKIKEYSNLNDALSQKPTMVFVTNPSKFHSQSAIEALKIGAFVFIEKPLSIDLESAYEILEFEKGIGKKLCMIGFQYRYNPALIKLKKLLNENIIGKIVNGEIANGEYLPDWHPYEDYSKGYAAVKKLGGGAILTQIHDFDYSIFLFGMPNLIFSIGGKISSLNTDVEDCVHVSSFFNFKNSPLPISINLDYISWPSRRYIKLYGEDGSIICDLNKNTIEVFLRVSRNVLKFDFSSISRNEIFLSELQNFIGFVKGEEEPKVDLNEGIKSLKFALAAKSSLNEKIPIELKI